MRRTHFQFTLGILCLFVAQEAVSQKSSPFGVMVESGYLSPQKMETGSKYGSRGRITLYRNIRAISVGAGFGFDRYNNYTYHTQPLFLDIRYQNLSRIKPFFQIGRSIGLYRNGTFMSIGVAMPVNKKETVQLSFAYNRQKIDSDSEFELSNSTIIRGLSFGLIIDPWQ